MREELVVDDLLRQVVDDLRKVVEQSNTKSTVGICERANYEGRDSGLEVFVGQLDCDFCHNRECLGATAAELDRFHQLWQDLHLEEILREVVG